MATIQIKSKLIKLLTTIITTFTIVIIYNRAVRKVKASLVN